jgi:hypothetical protein
LITTSLNWRQITLQNQQRAERTYADVDASVLGGAHHRRQPIRAELGIAMLNNHPAARSLVSQL